MWMHAHVNYVWEENISLNDCLRSFVGTSLFDIGLDQSQLKLVLIMPANCGGGGWGGGGLITALWDYNVMHSK